MFHDYIVMTLAEGSTGQTELSRILLGDLNLKILSDIDLQKRIGNLFFLIDSKINYSEKVNLILEKITQLLYKSWFIDFYPVKVKIKAKENGEDPQFAAMVAISGKTAEELQLLSEDNYKDLASIVDLFPDEMEETRFGYIPKGWRYSEIGKEVSIFGGSTPSTKEQTYWENGKNYWATPKDLSKLTEKILVETERRITDAGVSEISSGILPINTVLLSSRAPVGYLAISKIPVSINQGFIAMVCNKTIPYEYIVQWTESTMDEIQMRSGGTTFQEISKSNFKSIKILVPSKDILIKYKFIVSSIYNLITVNLKSNHTLEKLRDILIPELLSGKTQI